MELILRISIEVIIFFNEFCISLSNFIIYINNSIYSKTSVSVSIIAGGQKSRKGDAYLTVKGLS
jgi:hypothetical protein